MKKVITKLFSSHSLAILSAVYFVSRIINLTKLPIFNDEAIYLDWGWKSLHTSAGLFYSLYDAKPPFLIWVFGISESIFSFPLFIGRLVSVLVGLFTLIGIYKITKNLENERVALLASAFYIAIPLFAFFDRQALMESSITAVGVWIFYFLQKILETKSVKYSLFLGIILGIGIFIKLSGLIFLIPVMVILAYKKFFKEIGVVVATGLVVLTPLLFQTAFWTSLGANDRFALTPIDILYFPFSLWINNLSALINISFFHLTPFVFILTVYGVYLLIKKKNFILVTFFLINIIIVLFMSKSLNPRYLTSFLVPVTIFCSYAIHSFVKSFAFLAGATAILPPIITALLLLSPISYFNILDKFTKFSQKEGYVTGWTSGYGMPETINYINNQIKDKNIIVGVRLDSGNPESAMFTYFNNSNSVTIAYIDPRVMDPNTLKLNCFPSKIPVYFVARDGNLNGIDKFFTENKRFYKPEGQHHISIHTLKNCD